jgi:hypothetical protein
MNGNRLSPALDASGKPVRSVQVSRFASKLITDKQQQTAGGKLRYESLVES